MTHNLATGATAFDKIADEARWVAWREEERKGKPTKVPYCPAGGERAKPNDPSTWGTRAQAKAKAERLCNGHGNSGIGIVLGDLGNGVHLAGIDLDSCIDQHGGVAAWAAAIIALLPTYTEFSPSDTGIKIYFGCKSVEVRPFLELLGVAPDKWGTKRSIRADTHEHGPAVEVYCSHRYFAVTGKLWWGQPGSVEVLEWPKLEQLARSIQTIGRARPSSGGGEGGRDNTRSAKAFRKGAELRRAGATFEEICEALRTDPDPEIVAWVREKGEADDMRELHRIWDNAPPLITSGVSLDDFFAYMPSHLYIYAPTRELWPASSVNARIPPVLSRNVAGQIVFDNRGKPITLKASIWLDEHNPVEQMTWAPGLPMLIRGRLTSEGGWIERPNVGCFNLYRPPLIKLGDATQAKPWLDLLYKVFPDEAQHILLWFAHRVQRPGEKINHALVLGGEPGIGKDSLLEPVKHAVGPWNWHEVSPRDIIDAYNGFAKAVVLRVNEARDLGDTNRFQFYDHMTLYTAAPPDVLYVNEKYARQHYVTNCCGVIITTNHKADGIYLPADDRRHFVCWSFLAKGSFEQGYWNELWDWYGNGGDCHVAAYLSQLAIVAFNPKAPPPKTPAFWEIANSNRAPEDAEMADTLDLLGNPEAITTSDLISKSTSAEFSDWLADRKNRRIIAHRFEACGYVPVRNPDAPTDGLWKIGGRRQVIYAKANLALREQLVAARERATRRSPW